jgi:hypothetical protein
MQPFHSGSLQLTDSTFKTHVNQAVNGEDTLFVRFFLNG